MFGAFQGRLQGRLTVDAAQWHGHDHLISEAGRQPHFTAQSLADFQPGRRTAGHHPDGQR